MKIRPKEFVAAVDFSIDCRQYTAGDPYPAGDRYLTRLLRDGRVTEKPSKSTNQSNTEEASDGTE